MFKKKFIKKKLGSIKKIGSLKDLRTSELLIKTWVIIACVIIVFMIGKWGWSYATSAGKDVVKNITTIASKQVGEPLIADEYGNINILVAGYAGEDNRGGFLTDTVMLASYNPSLNAVTFLSIPRDLYVNYGQGGSGKLNGLYWASYIDGEDNHDVAARALADKVGDVTGIDVGYYAVVSFAGFVEFIDTLGGIDIDVPEPIYDTEYPGPNDSYTVFSVSAGWQTFDGETALKYARSRKSTSDFSRAIRQQQIIEAVLKKATSLGNITNILDLYENLDAVVKTNITGKQMIRGGQYLDTDKQYFSFVYTAECDVRYPDLTEPGCYLRYGDRERFGGAAVLLPEGGSPTNVSYYKKTQDFAFWVVHNQGFLKENASIRVLNGIDTKTARSQGYRINGVATQLSIDLILKGFTIEKVGNDEGYHTVTKLVVPGDGRYQETVKALAAFVDYKEVIADPLYGSGVTIILGDDYLKNL